MTRLRYVADVNPPVPQWDAVPDDVQVTFVPLEAVWPRAVDFSRLRPKAEVASGYTRFQEGDIVLPKITPTFQADRSTLIQGMPTRVGAGTTELHVIRAHRGVDPRFIDYLFSSRSFLIGGEAQMIGVAGQKRVPDGWVRDFPVLVTRLDEQRAIADFLDAETARIDALIAKKRRHQVVLLEHEEAVLLSRLGDWRSEPNQSLRQYGALAVTGPFGTQLAASEYVSGGTPVITDLCSNT